MGPSSMTKDLQFTTEEIVQQIKDAAARRFLKDADEYGCSYCKKIADEGGFGPSHVASERCESGHHEHCTCDTCF